MVKLSQYEIDREVNIARNRALLEELELKQAVEGLGFPTKSSKSATKKPVQPSKKKQIKKEDQEPTVRRQSARLRNVTDLNESPSRKRKREAELEEQRAKEAEERIEAEKRARIAKRPRHQDLELATTLDDEDAPERLRLADVLKGVSSTYAEEEGRIMKSELEDLKKEFKGMRLVSRAKVTENRVYSAAYHPDMQKDLIFFGDKHGQLGIWDAQAPPEEVGDEGGDVVDDGNKEGGKYWRLQVHWPATSKSSISCVKFNPVDFHTVYTSAYDCTIRNLSFTTGVSRQIFSSDETLLCSIDLTPTGNEMWVSDAAGGLTHLDLRQHQSKGTWYGLSDQKIGCVSVNPVRPEFVLTASNSRSLKIWDVRKLKPLGTPPTSSDSSVVEIGLESVNKFVESKKGHGCLRGEWRHEKSVSSAYWDPRGRSVVSTSYDDSIRLWNFDTTVFEKPGPFGSSKPFSRIKHNCQTGKWLTILRAQWSPNLDAHPHFTIGNMNHALDIFSGKGELITRLSDSTQISAVQAVTCSHPKIVARAVSGNASGRCVLWARE
ncbi:WD40 repeat-like protein [Guyanagaster necrorhizus]|uniref:DNA damage-binding protein CMR1 n=1 Tax=Guyanagaster necrorhizus TaxID=856835 RepID=A0A9P7W4I7_9AGAR|nr:WD40 repeat-like protein [Guyanagaster necrorhizus MCA 3950]KAG7452439.1 WD40 repeat-like protein [Guyanagaster necrorhizus MCA 3950]